MASPQFNEVHPAPGAGTARDCVDRAARFPSLMGMPDDGPKRLDALRVACIGAGSVGRSMLSHVARLQIAEMLIVDPGLIKQTTYATYPYLRPGEALGEPKATNAGRLVKALSPRTAVYAFDGGVEALSSTALSDVDYVLLATDRLDAEIETSQRCRQQGRKLIQASVHGETLVAQVRFLDNDPSAGRSPCLACGYGRAEWEGLNRNVHYSCEGARTDRPTVETEAAPTMSTSALCAMAAELAIMQVLKSVLELGPKPDNTILEYCGYTHRTVISKLTRNPICPCDHLTYRSGQLPRRTLDQCTLAELADAAGLAGVLSEVSFTVGDDLSFVESAPCRCGESVAVGRFFPPVDDEVSRCVCHASLRAHPFFTHRRVAASVAESVLHVPLRQLGAASVEWVGIRHADKAIQFRHAHNGKEFQDENQPRT